MGLGRAVTKSSTIRIQGSFASGLVPEGWAPALGGPASFRLSVADTFKLISVGALSKEMLGGISPIEVGYPLIIVEGS